MTAKAFIEYVSDIKDIYRSIDNWYSGIKFLKKFWLYLIIADIASY